MILADRLAQYRSALRVRDPVSGRQIELSGAASFAQRIRDCPLRFVLTDDLTRLCAELAYSKGAREVACADLLHVPAEKLWIEWCNAPWQGALKEYGFAAADQGTASSGRRGALICSSPDGRRGTIRTFWTLEGESGALASSMEAYFDFDTPDGEEPSPPDGRLADGICVYDGVRSRQDILGRCFRFRYEHSWAEYYSRGGLSAVEEQTILRHVLGTIAFDVPLLLAFLLLLASRAGLPRQVRTCGALNRARLKADRAPLLEHVEVRAPLLPAYVAYAGSDTAGLRRHPRLHHVRGHIVRRGSQLFWRVPHLRGSLRSGVLRTRTVIWSFDNPAAGVPQTAAG